MTEYSDNLTPDQYRREGAEAMMDAAALAAEDLTPSKHGGALAAHVTGMAIQKAIRAIDPADALAKVEVTNTELEPPRLMAMCGHCRSAGEEYCVQYLTDLRWDGAEWCCEDCFDGSGENGDWDEATQPCPQPAPDAVARQIKEAQDIARAALAQKGDQP